MRILGFGALAAAFLLVGAGLAHADTITFDFEGESTTGFISSLSVTESGLTITVKHSPGDFRVLDYTPSSAPASFGDRSIGFVTGGTWTINFSSALSSVSIDFGDGGADADTGTLKAYSGLDGTGTLIGTDTDTLAANVKGSKTLSLSGTSIKSITFYSSGLADEENVAWDNLVASPVPEPGTLALLGLGMAGLGWHRRRKMKAL